MLQCLNDLIILKYRRSLDTHSESLLRNVRASDETEERYVTPFCLHMISPYRHRHDSLNLEQKVSQCLSRLSGNDSCISIGHQALIMAMQKICRRVIEEAM